MCYWVIQNLRTFKLKKRRGKTAKKAKEVTLLKHLTAVSAADGCKMC